MVAGGLGICFIPEYSAVIPGLQVRPVTEPEVTRDVCLVTVAGRRFSPAVADLRQRGQILRLGRGSSVRLDAALGRLTA